MQAELYARDVMVRELITVSPETPILDIHRLFVEEEIHGAPVVGDDGIVCGVVSTIDLLRVVRDELDSSRSEDRVESLTAEQAMTTELVMVRPDTPIEEVARKMLEHRVHRVLVTGEDRQLVGVISAFDLVRVIANTPAPSQVRRTGFSL
jgi:CBS domain-containing protein